jgi:hypothetical protein
MMRARSPMPGWANDEPTVMSASVLTSAYGVVPSCERERSGRRGIGKRTMVLLPTLSLFTLGPQKAPRRSGVVGNSVSISEPRSTRCVSTQPIGVWALPSYPNSCACWARSLMKYGVVGALRISGGVWRRS